MEHNLVNQPSFCRSVRNSKEVRQRLAKGIEKKLPEIRETINGSMFHATIKPQGSHPFLREKDIPDLLPEELESTRQELRFRVTGLHVLGANAVKRLVCLTFEDPDEILRREQQEIIKRVQHFYDRHKKKTNRPRRAIPSGASPYIPIAVANIGLPESTLDEYAAKKLKGKDLYVELGALAAHIRGRVYRCRKSPRTTPAPKSHKPDSVVTEQTPSGITVVRLSPDRQPIPPGFLWTLRPN